MLQDANVTQAADSPTHKATSQPRFLRSGTAAAGSPLRPPATGTTSDVPVGPAAHQQQHLTAASQAPGQLSDSQPFPPKPQAQPNSTGTYTIRTHGPFSPSPVHDLQPQAQESNLFQPATALPSWGPPPPLSTSVPALAGSPAKLAGAAVDPGDVGGTQAAICSSTSKLTTTITAAAGPVIASQHEEKSSETPPAVAVPEATKVQQQQQVQAGDVQQAIVSSEEASGQPANCAVEVAEPPAATAIAGAAATATDSASAATAPNAAPAAQEPTAANGQIAQETAATAEPTAIAAALQAAIQEQQQQVLSKPVVPQPTAEAAVQHTRLPSSADSSSGASGSGPSSQTGSLLTASNETQLIRLVDTLRKRLDQVKAENQQLEDLVHAAEQTTAAEQQRAQQLAAELASMQRAQEDIVSSAAANAAAQDARIGQLQQELDAANRQVVALQGALETIQEQHQQVLSSKDAIEGGALEGWFG